jgi:hypothetical protein
MKRWGTIVLSIWLILSGLLPLLNLSFTGSGILLALLAILAGILLILGVGRSKLAILAGIRLILGMGRSKFRGNVGTRLLSIWLIAQGLFSLFSVSFTGRGIVMALLAIAAGVLLLVGW